MRKIAEKISVFVKDEEGLTMVEYAIAGSLVTGGVITTFTNLGIAIQGEIEKLTIAITG